MARKNVSARKKENGMRFEEERGGGEGTGGELKYRGGEKKVGDSSEVSNQMLWNALGITDVCEEIQIETKKKEYLCREQEPERFFFLPPYTW